MVAFDLLYLNGYDLRKLPLAKRKAQLKKLIAGTDIQFKGVVDSYTKEPYVLTLNIQEPKTDITGLPDTIKFVPDATPKPKPAAGRGAKAGTKKAQ